MSVIRFLEDTFREQIENKKIIYDLFMNERWFARAGRWCIITLNAKEEFTIEDEVNFAHEFGHLLASDYPELPEILEEIPSTLLEYWYVSQLPADKIFKKKGKANFILQNNRELELSKPAEIDHNGRATNRYAIAHQVAHHICPVSTSSTFQSIEVLRVIQTLAHRAPSLVELLDQPLEFCRVLTAS